MDRQQFTTVLTTLRTLFSHDAVLAIARSTGFCVRRRLIEPLALFLSIIAAMGQRSVESCADLWRLFNEWTGCNISYRSLYNQISKPAFASFMRVMVERMMAVGLGDNMGFPDSHAFTRFKRILIQDGSSFRIKDSLRNLFPGRFTSVSPAAVEIHVTFDLLADQPCCTAIAPDTQGERDFAPAPEALAGDLILVDRGYLDLDWMTRIHQAQGHFIGRAPISINPMVRRGWKEDGTRLENVHCRNLQDFRRRLPKRVRCEFDVFWPGNKALRSWRLICIWNKKRKEHTFLLTNVAREDVSLNDITLAYRLRWQVELYFKELKSYANLHKFDTGNAALAEGLMWAALAAALLKRHLAKAAQRVKKVIISTRKVAMSAGYSFTRVMLGLLQQRQRETAQALQSLIDFLASNARRAHPERDKKCGRQQLGLEVVGCA